MDNDTVEYRPQQNIIKESIEELIGVYTETKETFFMEATKEQILDGGAQAGQSYTILLRLIHTLLELSKPDNVNEINELIRLQELIEMLNQATEITDNEIDTLRRLCSELDLIYLRPHLATLPTVINC